MRLSSQPLQNKLWKPQTRCTFFSDQSVRIKWDDLVSWYIVDTIKKLVFAEVQHNGHLTVLPFHFCIISYGILSLHFQVPLFYGGHHTAWCRTTYRSQHLRGFVFFMPLHPSVLRTMDQRGHTPCQTHSF